MTLATPTASHDDVATPATTGCRSRHEHCWTLLGAGMRAARERPRGGARRGAGAGLGRISRIAFESGKWISVPAALTAMPNGVSAGVDGVAVRRALLSRHAEQRRHVARGRIRRIVELPKSATKTLPLHRRHAAGRLKRARPVASADPGMPRTPAKVETTPAGEILRTVCAWSRSSRGAVRRGGDADQRVEAARCRWNPRTRPRDSGRRTSRRRRRAHRRTFGRRVLRATKTSRSARPRRRTGCGCRRRSPRRPSCRR